MIDTIAGRYWTGCSITGHIGSQAVEVAFDAAGAIGAAVLLLFWVHSCTNGGF